MRSAPATTPSTPAHARYEARREAVLDKLAGDGRSLLGDLTEPDAQGRCRGRCPLHEDKNPSFVMWALQRNPTFCCSGCGAKGDVFDLVQQLHGLDGFVAALEWLEEHVGALPAYEASPKRPTMNTPTTKQDTHAGLTPKEADAVWAAAQARALNHTRRDDASRSYLCHRKLLPALPEGAKPGLLGLIGPGSQLPPAIRYWVSSGYHIVAPVYRAHGEGAGDIVGLQARHTSTPPDGKPKALVNRGCPTKGGCFTNGAGNAVLRGFPWVSYGEQVAILCEGMTDHAALGIAVPDLPVIACVGKSNAVSVIGPWARGLRILIALDGDVADDELASVADTIEQYGGSVHPQDYIGWGGGDACDALHRYGERELRRAIMNTALPKARGDYGQYRGNDNTRDRSR